MKIKKKELYYILFIFLFCIFTAKDGVTFSISLFFALILKICIIVKNREKIGFYKKVTIWFLFLMGIVMANNSGNTHWIRPFITFTMLIIFIGLSKNSSNDTIIVLLDVIIKFAIVSSFTIIVQLFVPNIFDNNIYSLYGSNIKQVLLEQKLSESYYAGIFPSPACASTILVCGIFALMAKKNKKIKNWMILFLGIVATGKRTQLLFVFVVAFGYIFFNNIEKEKRNRILKGILFVLIGLLLFYILILFAPTDKLGAIGRLIDGFKTIFQSADTVSLDIATAGRYSTYKEAWQYFLNHPIRGIGWNKFSEINYNVYLGTNLTNVHNIYIQLLCDAGIIGLLGFLIPAFYTLWYSKKYVRYNRVYLFAYLYQIYFLLFGLTETAFDFSLAYSIYFICIGFIISSRNQEGIKYQKQI